MKTKQIILAALVVLTGAWMGTARGATNDVSGLLQKGLFEEEANHNLEAAIQSYQAVITQTEKDRQFAATAIFRLGECYRKLGRTNEANVQYQRILKEFADQTELAKLSQGYVGNVPNATPAPGVRVDLLVQPDQETQELQRIQALIKDSPDLINGAPGGTPPLVQAADANQLTVARFLLDHKADVNARGNGSSAIIAAAIMGHKEMVELLAEHGADLNGVQDMNDSAPLHFAAQAGSKAMAEVLLAHKADVNVKTRFGKTPLHLAAENGFLSFAELLLANGANVSAQDDGGETPLHYAAKSDNRAIIEFLLAHKADVNARAHNGATPLLDAVQASRLNAARVLLANRADVNAGITAGNENGWLPLHFAIATGQPEMVKLLLENKADANAKIAFYSRALANQLGGGGFGGGGRGGRGGGRGGGGLAAPGVLPFAPDAPQYADIAPLGMAAVGGWKDIAELLLDHRAEVNALDKNSDTPLSLAVKLDQLELAELLLAHGATVQSLNNNHLASLSLAVQNNLADMVKLLLAHQPDLEVLDNHEATPLQSAMFINDRVNIAGMLLDAGANIKVVFNHDYGQSLQSPNGMPLLTLAVLRRDVEMVRLLLAHHANPDVRDNSGTTPLSLTKSFKASSRDQSEIQQYSDILDLLQKAGANENLQRLSQISVSRKGSQESHVFYKGTNSLNHFTLFDLLANHYAPAWWRPLNAGSRPNVQMMLDQLPGLPFPDFGKIRISRLGKDGRTNSIGVDVANALDSGDCSKDVRLEWGDIVEIPEADHNIKETWQGLPDSVKQALVKCLQTKVGIVVKGQTNEVTLRPLFYGYGDTVSFNETIGQLPRAYSQHVDSPGGALERRRQGGTGLSTLRPPSEPELVSFWLYDVVHAADVLLTSSDLSRVKVRRVDPTTRKTVEMVFDLEKNDPKNPLWLRDGDVIEVPEKL